MTGDSSPACHQARWRAVRSRREPRACAGALRGDAHAEYSVLRSATGTATRVWSVGLADAMELRGIGKAKIATAGVGSNRNHGSDVVERSVTPAEFPFALEMVCQTSAFDVTTQLTGLRALIRSASRRPRRDGGDCGVPARRRAFGKGVRAGRSRVPRLVAERDHAARAAELISGQWRCQKSTRVYFRLARLGAIFGKPVRRPSEPTNP